MIRVRLVGLALLWTIGAQPGMVQNVHAQTPASSAVDRLFRLSGTFRPADGGTAARVESVTLSIYAEEKGGAPLWQETQQVAIDAEGRYTVLIGSSVDGVPVDLFASGEPRWLALQFLRAGEVEQARTLATSVPYALRAAKAGDADTLGGLSASAFQLAATAAPGGASTSTVVGGAAATPIPSFNIGTTGFVGKFFNSGDLTNSIMFDTGSRVGLNVTAPLDVLHSRFTNTDGSLTGIAVQNLGSAANSYSGMLFYDHTGALGQFQGFNNSTKEYRINNVAAGGTINFMQGGTSRFLVAAGGNVGVGETVPSHKLDVLHSGSTGILVKSTASFSVLDIDAFSGDAAIRFLNNGTSSWNIRNQPGTDHFQFFELGGGGERMRIENSTGKVVMTGSDPTDQLEVLGNVRVGTGTTGCVHDADATVIAGTCSSDLRFKRDVTPFPSTLERLVQLRPVHFYWRSSEFADKRFGTRQSWGLVAQDVEEVLPELVTFDQQGYRAVNYSKLPLLTIQAVKDLKVENDALKAQNAALEARLSALEAAVKALTRP